MEKCEEEFGAFLSSVKAALEEGCGGVPRLAEIRRAAAGRLRLRFWRAGGALLAASFAVVCSFTALHLRAASQERNVAQIIDLLRAAEGDEDLAEAGSVAEMLLAWQDAPYENAIASFPPAE